MLTATTPYVGNSHYCYANATSMLLASVGERISPAVIEVLTGLALGAAWVAGPELIFFNSSAPDIGVSRALRLLGFAVDERASADDDLPPLHDLRAALAEGSAILGPVDMGMLVYQPGKGRPNGVDHFIVAYGVEDAEVLVHDPAGYPSVSLLDADLAVAWRAELVGYRRGAYRWWTAPRRIATPTADELFARAMREFGQVYRDAAAHSARVTATGRAAIDRLAGMVRTGDLPPALEGHLRGFALPVGARRALDFSDFFRQRAPALAALKQEQARLFGRTQTRLTRQDWTGAADALIALADTEEQIRDLIVGDTPVG